MEIISVGNRSKKMPEVQVECPNCKSILSVNRMDIQYTDIGRAVECPICGNYINLTEKEREALFKDTPKGCGTTFTALFYDDTEVVKK